MATLAQEKEATKRFYQYKIFMENTDILKTITVF